MKAGTVAIILCGASLALYTETGWTQEPLPDRFSLSLGAYYIEDSDTEVKIRSATGVVGTSINLSKDLDTEERVNGPKVVGFYRFNPRHRIDFSWFKLDRDGRRTIGRSLQFGNITYNASAQVDSSVKTELWKLLYTWSFYRSDKVELGLSGGLYKLDYELDLRSSVGNSQSASLSQPLPVVGFRMDYAITPKWHASLDLENFYVELNDDFRGSAYDISAGVDYRALKNVSFGLKANRLAIDAASDSEDWRGSLTDLYRGFYAYVGLHY